MTGFAESMKPARLPAARTGDMSKTTITHGPIGVRFRDHPETPLLRNGWEFDARPLLLERLAGSFRPEHLLAQESGAPAGTGLMQALFQLRLRNVSRSKYFIWNRDRHFSWNYTAGDCGPAASRHRVTRAARHPRDYGIQAATSALQPVLAHERRARCAK